MDCFLWGIVIIVSGGFLSLLVPDKIGKLISLVSISFGSVLCSIPAIGAIFHGGTYSASIFLSFPFGMVKLVLDPLSAFFIILIGIGGISSSLYASGYCQSKGRSLAGHLFFFNLIVASMLMVTVVQHTLFFLVVWEMMSLSSVILVLFNRTKNGTGESVLFYTIAMHIGVICLLAGFLVLSISGNSYNFEDLSALLQKHDKTAQLVFILLFAGFGIKVGFVPFHGWIPRIYSVAPGNVAAFMSSTMIKIGIYGILRLLFLYGKPTLSQAVVVIIIALASALFGVLNAMVSRNMRKLLAYSSIENLGIVGVGIGFGMMGLSLNDQVVALLGFAGALFHTINHTLFKGLLFFGAGAVERQTDSLDMEKLGGLAKKMPLLAFLTVCGCCAISALPPFNGFSSEFVIISGMISSLKTTGALLTILVIGAIAVLGLVGGMALIAFTKYFSIPFLGSPRSSVTEHTEEPSLVVMTPIILLTLIALSFGLFPQIVIQPIERIAQFLTGGGSMSPVFVEPEINGLLSSVSKGMLLLVGSSVVIIGLRKFLLRGRAVSKGKTWGCGYQTESPRIQYTAHSFVQPFVFLTGKYSGVKKTQELPQGIFPRTARFMVRRIDAIEYTVVNPTLKFIKTIFDRALDLQTSRIQIYILYGFLFLIAALVYTILGGN
jgi:formate hydrogenlyase subunit 3/multisubunit Na+/H+ antiporter MnhD subunit